jgi:hypothetical protein
VSVVSEDTSACSGGVQSLVSVPLVVDRMPLCVPLFFLHVMFEVDIIKTEKASGATSGKPSLK